MLGKMIPVSDRLYPGALDPQYTSPTNFPRLKAPAAKHNYTNEPRTT